MDSPVGTLLQLLFAVMASSIGWELTVVLVAGFTLWVMLID